MAQKCVKAILLNGNELSIILVGIGNMGCGVSTKRYRVALVSSTSKSDTSPGVSNARAVTKVGGYPMDKPKSKIGERATLRIDTELIDNENCWIDEFADDLVEDLEFDSDGDDNIGTTAWQMASPKTAQKKNE